MVSDAKESPYFESFRYVSIKSVRLAMKEGAYTKICSLASMGLLTAENEFWKNSVLRQTEKERSKLTSNNLLRVTSISLPSTSS